MAGHRRRSGKPPLVTARPQRRLAILHARLAGTADPLARVAAAVDYYRAALARNPQPASAERVVALLQQEGERLFAARETTR